MTELNLLKIICALSVSNSVGIVFLGLLIVHLYKGD
jgi:hypothetical protein